MKKALILLSLLCSLCYGSYPKAIVFDYCGVVASVERAAIVNYLIATLGIPKEEVRCLHNRSDEELKAYARAHGIEDAESWLDDLINLFHTCLHTDEGTMNIIEELKSSCYTVALLSNVTEKGACLIQHAGGYAPFDPVLLSCEIGVNKPDVRAYQILCDTLQLPPEEIVFIDDLPENVEAANAFGIKAIQFTSADQLRSDLERRGLLPCQKKLSIDGKTFYTEHFGHPSNPPILLLNGAGTVCEFWNTDFIATLVNQGYFVIRYDHRDAGRSFTSHGFYGMEELAYDAFSVINGYGLEAVDLIGHSMGGMIAQFMVLQAPERVKSMILIGSAPIAPTPSTQSPLTEEERAILRETEMYIFSPHLAQSYDEIFAVVLDRILKFNGLFPVEHRYTYPFVHASCLYTPNNCLPHFQAAAALYSSLHKREGCLEGVTTPTLILHGDIDYALIVNKAAHGLKEALPHAKLVIFEGMGHIFFNETLQNRLLHEIKGFLP